MSWSQTSSIVPSPNTGKVKIKTKFGELNLTNIEETQVAAAIATSRTILPFVLARLVWPTGGAKAARNAHMAQYFLTAGGGPTDGEIETVYKKLELVMNGINAKINLKVAEDDDAYGYVGFKTGVVGALRGVFSPRHNIGKRQGKIVSRGDIHLDRDVLGDAALSVITFIHEATHKYASTADHAASGYLNAAGTAFNAIGLTKAQALNNADSYAYFCYMEHTNP